MTSRLRRLLSFNSDSGSSDIVNFSEARTGPIFEDNYHNWTIPKVDVDTIYKIGIFNLMSPYFIKTHEEVISLQNGLQTIAMIKQNSIESHLKADYKFMHIGLVQVATKLLVKRGISAPIFMALRDK